MGYEASTGNSLVRLEFDFIDIAKIYMRTLAGTQNCELHITLTNPSTPLFQVALDKTKDTNWELTTDWTENSQASTVPLHVVIGEYNVITTMLTELIHSDPHICTILRTDRQLHHDARVAHTKPSFFMNNRYLTNNPEPLRSAAEQFAAGSTTLTTEPPRDTILHRPQHTSGVSSEVGFTETVSREELSGDNDNDFVDSTLGVEEIFSYPPDS